MVAGALALGLAGSLVFAGWAAARRLATPPAPAGESKLTRHMKAALASAEDCIPSILGYDHRTFDQNVVRGRKCATGGFRKEYEQTMRDLRPTVVAKQTVVTASVKEIGVMSAELGQVRVLAYVNRRRENKSRSRAKVDPDRVQVTLVLRRGAWLVSEAITI